MYDLAEQAFSGTFATGETANNNVPPTSKPNAPADSVKTKKKKKSKKWPAKLSNDKDTSSDSEADSNLAESNKDSTATLVKQVCKTIGLVVTKSIEGLIGEINQATGSISPTCQSQVNPVKI